MTRSFTKAQSNLKLRLAALEIKLIFLAESYAVGCGFDAMIGAMSDFMPTFMIAECLVNPLGHVNEEATHDRLPH